MPDPLSNYLDFYRSLAPHTVEGLRELVAPQVHFRDPFNDVRDVELMIEIFRDMFESTVDPRFAIESAVGAVPHVFIRWQFTFLPRGSWARKRSAGGEEHWVIDGASEVKWDERGLVIAHLDFWDPAAAIYERLPVIGAAMRGLKKRMGAR